MIFNFIDVPKELEFALGVAGEKLGLVKAKSGAKVLVKKVAAGISVEQKDGEFIIGYSSISNFCRALMILKTGVKEGQKVFEEACFSEMGLMMDNSRNAVAKKETVKDMAVYLAIMGYNELLLYTEDTFEVQNQPYFGYMRGRFTAQELKEIDEFCIKIGIELVPCIQTLAHINQITRYAHYFNMVDVNDILMVGDERTYKLIEDIFCTLANNFSSRRVNIGMDEAHMLGLGKYLDKHGFTDRFKIMLEHLKRVTNIAKSHGFKVEMWSDMFFRLVSGGEYYSEKAGAISEEHKKLIDKDITLLYWDYYNLDYKHYEKMMERHFLLSDNIGFAGGAWKWSGIAPYNYFSIKANEASVAAARARQIKRFLLTSWGDNGAEASHFSVMPAIFRAAQNAYSSSNDSYFETLCGISIGEFMQLDAPNRFMGKDDKRRENPVKYLLYNDALQGAFDSCVPENVESFYKSIADKLNKTAMKSFKFNYMFKSLGALCEVLIKKAELSKNIKTAYDKKDLKKLESLAANDIPYIIDKLEIFYSDFKEQWHAENKTFGFEVQSIRIGGLIMRLGDVTESILAFTNGNKTVIEECECERLPFAYSDAEDHEILNFNLWHVNVTSAII